MGDHPRKLPTLVPGPRAAAAPSTASTSRPKKNSTACLACKQAKRKVSFQHFLYPVDFEALARSSASRYS